MAGREADEKLSTIIDRLLGKLSRSRSSIDRFSNVLALLAFNDVVVFDVSLGAT